MNPRRFIPLFAFALTGACTDPIHLGAEGLYWNGDTETGNLDQWKTPGPDAGKPLLGGGGSLNLAKSPVHGGRWAVQTTISPVNGRLAFARLIRNDVPQDAYFSVWMYIPEQYSIAKYWSVFEFQGRSNPTDDSTWMPTWSLNLRQGTNDDMTWYVYDSLGRRELKPRTPVSAQIGRWFQIQAFVHQATDNTGQIAFWIDGSPIIEQSDVPTVPTMWMLWSVGSASTAITKTPADLYIDDAAIALAP